MDKSRFESAPFMSFKDAAWTADLLQYFVSEQIYVTSEGGDGKAKQRERVCG